MSRCRRSWRSFRGVIDLPNAVVKGVGDVKVALGVECDVERLVEASLDGGAAVAAIAGLARTDRGDNFGLGRDRKDETNPD